MKKLLTIENIIHIFITIMFPISINLFAMIVDVGFSEISKSLFGEFIRFGIPYNPWPDIIPSCLIILSILIFIAWCIDKIFSMPFIITRKQLLRNIIIVFISVIGATVFYFGTILLSYTWIGIFHDSQLGLPMSNNLLLSTLFIQSPALFVLFLLSGIRRKV